MMDKLGATEQLVVDRLRKSAAAALVAARELVADLEKMEDAEWERLMEHPKAKDAAVSLLDPLEKLSGNLQSARLLCIIGESVTHSSTEAWNR